MKRRATSLLFAVATGAPIGLVVDTARADAPAPTVQPRVLPTGAPACGNIALWKGGMVPGCAEATETIRDTTRAVVSEAKEIGRVLAVFDGFADHPLTVAEARRPRS